MRLFEILSFTFQFAPMGSRWGRNLGDGDDELVILCGHCSWSLWKPKGQCRGGHGNHPRIQVKTLHYGLLLILMRVAKQTHFPGSTASGIYQNEYLVYTMTQ